MEKRKHPRLKGYDYGKAGGYFITFCTKDREHLLSDIVGRGALAPPEVVLREPGMILDTLIQNAPKVYPGVVMEKYVIMPNHVHLLIRIAEEEDGGAGAPRPTVPQIVGGLKSLTRRRTGRPLWQTSFYDHVIRDEADYLRIWNYIDTNPGKWQEDEYYTPPKER